MAPLYEIDVLRFQLRPGPGNSQSSIKGDDPEEIWAALLDAFKDEVMTMVLFWNADSWEKGDTKYEPDLIERGLLAAGGATDADKAGRLTREKPILNGKFLAAFIGVSPGWTTDDVPPNRPSREGSVEDDIGKAFEMQLNATIDVLIEAGEGKPKKDGPKVREALASLLDSSLDLNKKQHTHESLKDRLVQAAERIRHLASKGKNHCARLVPSRAVGGAEASHEVPKRFSAGRLIACADILEAIETVPHPSIRRELSLLAALARMKELARVIRSAQLEARRDESAKMLRSMPMEDLVRANRQSRAVAQQIVEVPQLALGYLEQIASFSFRAKEIDCISSFIRLALEIATRYEVDVLELFPSKAAYRSLTQAARACSANRRRGVLPDKGTFEGAVAYWGLRAIMDGNPRYLERRATARIALGEVTSELRHYAFSTKPAPLPLESLYRFTN